MLNKKMLFINALFTSIFLLQCGYNTILAPEEEIYEQECKRKTCLRKLNLFELFDYRFPRLPQKLVGINDTNKKYIQDIQSWMEEFEDRYRIYAEENTLGRLLFEYNPDAANVDERYSIQYQPKITDTMPLNLELGSDLPRYFLSQKKADPFDDPREWQIAVNNEKTTVLYAYGLPKGKAYLVFAIKSDSSGEEKEILLLPGNMFSEDQGTYFISRDSLNRSSVSKFVQTKQHQN